MESFLGLYIFRLAPSIFDWFSLIMDLNSVNIFVMDHVPKSIHQNLCKFFIFYYILRRNYLNIIHLIFIKNIWEELVIIFVNIFVNINIFSITYPIMFQNAQKIVFMFHKSKQGDFTEQKHNRNYFSQWNLKFSGRIPWTS